MENIRSFLDSLLFRVGAALMGVILASLSVGVIFRYVLNNPLQWTNELATLALTWMVFVSGAVALSHREHINVDVFVLHLPAKAQLAIGIFVDVVTTVMFILLAVVGARYTVRISSAITSSMQISQGYVYAAAPVASAVMLLYQIDNLRQRIKSNRRGGVE